MSGKRDCPHYQFPMAQDNPTSRRGKNISASSGLPKPKAALWSPTSQEIMRKQHTQLLAVPSALGYKSLQEQHRAGDCLKATHPRIHLPLLREALGHSSLAPKPKRIASFKRNLSYTASISCSNPSERVPALSSAGPACPINRQSPSHRCRKESCHSDSQHHHWPSGLTLFRPLGNAPGHPLSWSLIKPECTCIQTHKGLGVVQPQRPSAGSWSKRTFREKKREIR